MKSFIVALIATLTILRLDLCGTAPTADNEVGPNKTADLCGSELLKSYISAIACTGCDSNNYRQFKHIHNCNTTNSPDELVVAFSCDNGINFSNYSINTKTMQNMTKLFKKFYKDKNNIQGPDFQTLNATTEQ